MPINTPTSDILVQEQGGGPTPWRSLSIPMPNIEPIIEKLQSFITNLKTVIDLILGLIDTLLAFIVAIADPLAALIRAILDQIRALLEKYLEGAGLFALYVPFAKRMTLSLPNTTFDLTINPSVTFDKPVMGGGGQPTSISLFTDKNALNDKRYSDSTRRLLANASKRGGGNAGFYRTVAASLADSRDHCRPQFMSPNDYVAGGVIVFGSDFDPFRFLEGLLAFKGLFGELFAMSGGIPDLPKPKNLKAESIFGFGLENQPAHGEKGKFQALLMWDIPDLPVHTIPDLGGIIVVPKRLAVIAVKNNVAKSYASNVYQLFGTKELTKGMEVNGAYVLDEKVYIPGETMYVTTTLDTARDDIWTFYLAYSLQGYNQTDNFAKSQGNYLGYWYLSNSARLTPMQIATSGTPPDWVRTPSIADLLPPLAAAMRSLVAFLETLASYIPSALEYLAKFIDFMRSELRRYERMIDNILSQISALLEMLKIGTLGGFYTKSFYGKGGNQFFLNDLAQSLSEDYPNAPPFHNGDEFVTGLIVLAGGTQPTVQAAQPLLSLLFGSDNISSQARDVMDSLGEQEDALQLAWDEALGVTPPQEDKEPFSGLVLCQPPSAPVIPFNVDLTPANQG